MTYRPSPTGKHRMIGSTSPCSKPTKPSRNSWTSRMSDDVLAFATPKRSKSNPSSHRSKRWTVETSDRFIPSRQSMNIPLCSRSLLQCEDHSFKSSVKCEYERELLSSITGVSKDHLNLDSNLRCILPNHGGHKIVRDAQALNIRGCRFTIPSALWQGPEKTFCCGMSWNRDGYLAVARISGFDTFDPENRQRKRFKSSIHGSHVLSIAWCQRGGKEHMFVVGTAEGEIIAMDRNASSIVWRRDVCNSPIRRIEWTHRCITAAGGSTVYMIDFDGNDLISELKPSGGKDVSFAKWNVDESACATGALFSQYVHVYDASMISSSSSHKTSPRVSLDHSGKNKMFDSSVDWCPFRRGVLACAGMQRNVDLWDTNSGIKLLPIEIAAPTAICFSRVSNELFTSHFAAIHPDEEYFSNQMSVWKYGDSDAMVLRKRFSAGFGFDGIIMKIQGSEKTGMIATVSTDTTNEVRFWNVFEASKNTLVREEEQSQRQPRQKSFLHQMLLLR